MSYKPDRRRALGLLVSSMISSTVIGTALSQDIYIGSPFSPDWRAIPAVLLALALPASVFALFFVWPVALAGEQLAETLARRYPQLGILPAWLLTGALLGPPAMLIYSVLLGLGLDLLGLIVVNGLVAGLLSSACAFAIVRPKVSHGSIFPEAKTADS